MKKIKNPFKIKTSETKQVRIHKDLVNVLEKERRKQQKLCDTKLGARRFKISLTYASKVLGGYLK